MGDELDEMTESMSEVMSLEGDPAKLAAYYADWASEYDADVASHGYGLPDMMAETLGRTVEAAGVHPDRSRAWVLDAGCGTGLVGLALHAAGWTELHGVDLSPEMATLARARGIYVTLEGGVDLTDPPRHLTASADVVTVGGVFTVGHVPPETLESVARLARPGGLVVVSTRRAYLQETAFREVGDRLVSDGVLELLVHVADAPYTMDSTGDYWGYRVVTS